MPGAGGADEDDDAALGHRQRLDHRRQVHSSTVGMRVSIRRSTMPTGCAGRQLTRKRPTPDTPIAKLHSWSSRIPRAAAASSRSAPNPLDCCGVSGLWVIGDAPCTFIDAGMPAVMNKVRRLLARHQLDRNEVKSMLMAVSSRSMRPVSSYSNRRLSWHIRALAALAPCRLTRPAGAGPASSCRRSARSGSPEYICATLSSRIRLRIAGCRP